MSVVAEACKAAEKVDGANAVVVSGTHNINRSIVSEIPIIDATLAGLHSVEG